jgi:hypothetical protein
VPLCPPQIPHELTLSQTRAAAMIAWAVARPMMDRSWFRSVQCALERMVAVTMRWGRQF